MSFLPVATRRAEALSERHVVPFAPVGPGISAELAALSAPHARAEGRHWNIIRPGVDVELGMVIAGPAGHIKPADAVVAHVAERHGVDWFVIPGHLNKLRTDRERNQALS